MGELGHYVAQPVVTLAAQNSNHLLDNGASVADPDAVGDVGAGMK